MASWKECIQTSDGPATLGEPSMGRLDVGDLFSSELLYPPKLLYFANGIKRKRLGTLHYGLEDQPTSSECHYNNCFPRYRLEYRQYSENDLR